MGIIQCSEKCKFQTDGYCNLEKCSTVGILDNKCPYYIPKLFDDRNSLTETSDTYKF